MNLSTRNQVMATALLAAVPGVMIGIATVRAIPTAGSREPSISGTHAHIGLGSMPLARVPATGSCLLEPTTYPPLSAEVQRQVLADFRAANPGVWGFDDQDLDVSVGRHRPILLGGVRGGEQGRNRHLTTREVIARARRFLVANARFFGLTHGEATALPQTTTERSGPKPQEGPKDPPFRQGAWYGHTYVWFEALLPWLGDAGFPEITRDVRVTIEIGVDGEVTWFDARNEFWQPQFPSIPVAAADLRLARTALRGSSLVHTWSTVAAPDMPLDTPGLIRSFTSVYLKHTQPLAPVTDGDLQRIEPCVEVSRLPGRSSVVVMPCLAVWIAKGRHRFSVRLDRCTGTTLTPIIEQSVGI